MDIARFVDGVADLTEVVSRTGVVARRSQADHVEGVQKVAAEFNVTSFGDREVLGQGEVNLLITRITFRAYGSVSKARSALLLVSAGSVVGVAGAGSS